ncbi:hypothetical protein [Lactiplantibacillus mudanjiangensis]|uniref:S-layer protein n=1 Tax=Lactiplantibacillus mudanjiangensis TaxID=1296538 RepID=A0A660DZ12_9LACO|nr:hypothetical protein [Lactiplantibacillus mudanjiangensis]VDG26197.1 hypothetical protein [Lactobacillus brevis] [Lactiplantibacillus mudanjiangensis]VDG27353.1 hypothetical protein [Lactobacillus brevis] [Lactiplantibacillus mudanjiangensis]
MQSTLAKSVFVGVAALSFASVAQLNANAATKTTTKSNVTLTTDATTRNVVPTGSNAIYSYPKTVKKSARTIASKATVAKLASSKSSKDYFRAYRVLTTSKGSVYYKVVSFDGSVRGYIYGGKSTSAFAGGLKAATTTTDVTLSATDKAKTYYFASAGTKNVTWNAPQYTQYKASKNVKNTTPFKYDALTVTDAVKKTREGSVYYKVTDAQNPSVSGWVYAKALTTTKPAVAYAVTINYKTLDGTLVKSSTFTNKTAVDVNSDVTSAFNTYLTTAAVSDLKGTGYNYTAADSTNVAATKSVKAGTTVNLLVSKNAETSSKLAFKVSGTATVAPKTIAATDLKDGKFPTVAQATQDAALKGVSDSPISFTNLESNLLVSGKPLYQLTGTTTKSTDGKTQTTTLYNFDKATTEAANKDAKYGDTVTLYYTTSTTTSAVTSTNDNTNANNNYAN